MSVSDDDRGGRKTVAKCLSYLCSKFMCAFINLLVGYAMRFSCVRREACDLPNQTGGYRDKG